MSKFILTGFGDEIAPELDEQMRVMKELSISHIELRGVDGRNIASYTAEEAKKVAARMAAQGFRTSAVGSPIGKYPIVEPFAPHLDAFKNVLDVALALNAPFIRLFSFFYPAGDDPERYRDEVLERLSRFVEVARGSGVTLVHENEKDIYGDVADRCLTIMKAFPGDMYLTYDPSNFVQCGEDNRRAFEMLKPYIRYVHMKDSVLHDETGRGRDMGFENVSDAHRPVGQGDGQVEWILSELVQDGYEGYLSIEPHLTSNEGVPGTGADKFRVATEALQNLLKRVMPNG